MRVLIDRQPVELELTDGQTLGGLVEQVRAHVAEQRRVLAGMSVEGQPVPAEQLDSWLQRDWRSVGAVEFSTACPRGIARQAIKEVSALFSDSLQLQQGSAEKLAAGQTGKAMEQLAGCLGLYKAAQEAIAQAVRLNRLDLNQMPLGEQPISAAIAGLTGRLAEVKAALEARDLVLLGDLLTYEFPKLTEAWLAILAELDRRLAD